MGTPTAPIWIEFRKHGYTSNSFYLDINSIVRIDDADWGTTQLEYTVGSEARTVIVEQHYREVIDKIRKAIKLKGG